jgi:DNA-binding MarR family transcriptional regulator
VTNARHTAAGKACTELILDTFRLNGRLLVAGDALTRGSGITSARWQILGAIAHAEEPPSVADIARSMGLRRQGIQRVVDVLAAKGLLRFADNPRHARAKLVSMTAKGEALYRKTAERQVQWVNELSAGLSARELDAASAVLKELHQRLSRREKEAS